MSINTEKLAEIYFILDKLERPDLKDFIEERLEDPDYNSDSATEEEEGVDDICTDDLIPEKYKMVKKENGFYEMLDCKQDVKKKNIVDLNLKK